MTSDWRQYDVILALYTHWNLFISNSEFNDLRKIMFFEKIWVYVKKKKKKQFQMSLTIWWNMAYTVCHAPI